jgi:hypothetical protein
MSDVDGSSGKKAALAYRAFTLSFVGLDYAGAAFMLLLGYTSFREHPAAACFCLFASFALFNSARTSAGKRASPAAVAAAAGRFRWYLPSVALMAVGGALAAALVGWSALVTFFPGALEALLAAAR